MRSVSKEEMKKVTKGIFIIELRLFNRRERRKKKRKKKKRWNRITRAILKYLIASMSDGCRSATVDKWHTPVKSYLLTCSVK